MRARMALILAGIQCEIREVSLKNKPQAMLVLSPKGTVPVLLVDQQVIDESIEIIRWAFARNDSLIKKLTSHEMQFTHEMIEVFDCQFKFHLDRYKYFERFDSDFLFHREECTKILAKLESKISEKQWIFSEQLSLLDIAVLPFIRQFKIADPDFFFSQPHKKTIRLLKTFETSRIFTQVMQKYELWNPDDAFQVFLLTKDQ